MEWVPGPNSFIEVPKNGKTYFDAKCFFGNPAGIGLFDYQMVGDRFKMIIGDDVDGFRDDSFDESIDLVQRFGSNLIKYDRK